MAAEIATLREIKGQPQVWRDTFTFLEEQDFAALLRGFNPRATEWIFVGCGTSYYLAQAAAASVSTLLKAPARALPASEILFFPAQALPQGPLNYIYVLISRSGHTSEVLLVAEYLRKQKAQFIAITCDGRELTTMTDRVLKLPVHEKSTVMTSSFTSMLLALQYVAAALSGDKAFLLALKTLPDALHELLDRHLPAVESFAKNPIDDAAFLGQGALFPIACESSLKVMESSSTYAQYFHTLEFRHGPKSIAGPSTLVGALISESGFDAEVSVLQEMKQLGATTFAVANSASTELCSAADLLIELGLSKPELSRIAVYVVWGQLLGSFRGLEKGLDPDNPRNLNRVVTI